MNHRDLVVRAPDVGMGVGLAGAPVGRPPSMTHTAARLGKIAVSLPDGDRQVIERAYLPGYLDSRFGQGQGKPRRVVTPVLEASQTLHEYLHAPLSASVTDDSAHTTPPHSGAKAPGTTEDLGRARRRQRESRALARARGGVLSPASPPGFVAALTTARRPRRTRRKLDKRLPRRLQLRCSSSPAQETWRFLVVRSFSAGPLRGLPLLTVPYQPRPLSSLAAPPSLTHSDALM